MQATIICFVGDGVLCKNELDEVINLSNENLSNYNPGDSICIDEFIERETQITSAASTQLTASKSNEGFCEENLLDTATTASKTLYYLCDDILVFKKGN